MIQKIFTAAIVLLAATSCSNDREETVVENNAEQGYAPVTVQVADFSVTQRDFSPTRAAENPIDYDGVGAMTLAFYDATGAEQYKSTQVRSDGGTYTTFGSFTANLPIGNYTMVALGYAYYDGDVFTLISPTEAAFTSERPRETFCVKQDVTVTNTTPLNLNVTLNRISSKLEIISTDNRPAGIAKMRTTLAKGGKSFNPTTGLALTDTGYWQTNSPSAAVGTAIDIAIYPFLYTDEETMDVTIEVLDAGDNVLFTKVVSNVPFKRNRATKMSGAVFTAGTSGAAFKLETEWLEDATVTF